jgi:hypothetical protein
MDNMLTALSCGAPRPRFSFVIRYFFFVIGYFFFVIAVAIPTASN